MYLLAKRLFRTDKKNTKVREYRSLSLKKNSEQSADRDFLLVRQFCRAFFERNPYFFIFFFLRSPFLCVGFCTVYIRYRWPDTMCQTLERLLML